MQVEKPFVLHGGLKERLAMKQAVSKSLDGTGIRQHYISAGLSREGSRQQVEG